ncbi:MAG: NUDIX domain-containing protein [Bacteroidetes bacterium]|nr:NUDIX domain-containing protein [Bacteroidota bacterium]
MLGDHNLMILRMLDCHETPFKEEKKHHHDIFNFVKSNQNYWQRSNLAGHLTGSAWVLHPKGDRVLLIHHKKLDRWLQPGGHVDEQDETIWATAHRELVEETGLRDVSMPSNQLFDVDVHEIPARKEEPAHFHYDMRFLFQANTEVLDADFSEVKNIRWVPLLDLIGETVEQSIRRMALKTIGD